jgi:hypothetical protein
MDLEEIYAMGPDKLCFELARLAVVSGLGDQRDVADMLADESLLLQPIECDPSGATGWPHTDSMTGEFCYDDED